MYLEFYTLKEKPFSLTPDPCFLYYSKAHRRAIAFLKYGLQESKGFLQLTGPIGSGKTTLLRAILEQLDDKTKTAYIINPTAPFPDLLRTIMRDLEVPNIPQTRSKTELLNFLHDYLLIQMKRSIPVVVIFDEAQNISLKNLEEIRMLSNFETKKEKLIQIVFVGQPELIRVLDRPELQQLKQRIQIRYHLSALGPAEVKEYINHRLNIAGSNGGIVFSDDACSAVYEFSGGIPRLINSVCDIVLLIGYVSERKQFDATAVQEAIREMQGSFVEEQPAPEPDRQPCASEEETLAETASTSYEKNEGAPDCRISPIEKPHTSGLQPDSIPVQSETTAINESPCQPSHDGSKMNACKPLTSTPASLDTAGEQENLLGATDVCLDEAITGNEECVTEPEPAQSQETRALGQVIMQRKPSSNRNLQVWRNILQGGSSFLGLLGDSRLSIDLGGMIRKFAKDLPWKRNGARAAAGMPERRCSKQSASSILIRKERQNQDSERPKGAVTHIQLHPSAASDPSQKVSRSADESNKMVPLPSNKCAHDSPCRKACVGETGDSSSAQANRRISVLFRDGTVSHGVINELDLKSSRVHLSPGGPSDHNGGDIVSLEEVLAVGQIEKLRDSGKDYLTSGELPKGDQIIVTLLNDDVIKGHTFSRFDPACERFFVVSPGDCGDLSWVLIERSGTRSILTEAFKEGTIGHDLDNREGSDATHITDVDVSRHHESAGDLYFSLNDYNSALLEYKIALVSVGQPDRLRLKISLCHYNRGVNHMKAKRYAEAKKELERVDASAYLRTKARMKIRKIRKKDDL
ncbi:MAG: hypothetical protein C4532_06260 [Candidatus Abyssobacteria bacterium SURF_17]|uniref:AAA+ ATPase domain-containing protein n=1 Tax=Candidatus Abyssobacteria bacterium SURF_17 TaxID=2093361 RepID=A0A419F220_9BACT|nr:MAG: hypothetical protein C4532_06260 [Candidatus Abyssubacteria bacterium SURF_17]